MEINGIAHVMLTVTSVRRSKPFYAELLGAFGMKPVIDTETYLYCVGGRTACGIQEVDAAHADDRFVQRRVGLHHVCFRARERDDVDRVYELVQRLGATIVHPPREDQFAPGYYSVLFEDPDGIRLEVNFVPGKGLLAEKSS